MAQRGQRAHPKPGHGPMLGSVSQGLTQGPALLEPGSGVTHLSKNLAAAAGSCVMVGRWPALSVLPSYHLYNGNLAGPKSWSFQGIK